MGRDAADYMSYDVWDSRRFVLHLPWLFVYSPRLTPLQIEIDSFVVLINTKKYSWKIKQKACKLEDGCLGFLLLHSKIINLVALNNTHLLLAHGSVVRSWNWLGSLLRLLQDWNQGVSQADCGGFEEESPKLISFVGRILFLVVVNLRSPFPPSLLALGGCSLVFAYGPLHLRSQQWLVESFLFFEYLWLPLLLPAEKTVFKGITWLGQAYPYNLHTLKSINLGLQVPNPYTAVSRLVFNWITKEQKSWGIIFRICLPQLVWRGNLSKVKISSQNNWVICLLGTFCSVSITAFPACIFSWKGFQCNSVVTAKAMKHWKYVTGDLRFLFTLKLHWWRHRSYWISFNMDYFNNISYYCLWERSLVFQLYPKTITNLLHNCFITSCVTGCVFFS